MSKTCGTLMSPLEKMSVTCSTAFVQAPLAMSRPICRIMNIGLWFVMLFSYVMSAGSVPGWKMRALAEERIKGRVHSVEYIK